MADRSELKYWREHYGILRDVARHYIDRNIKYEDAAEWIASKIPDESAAEYAFLGAPLAVALFWYNNNQMVAWYGAWKREGFTDALSIRWIAAGFDAWDAAGWINYQRRDGDRCVDPLSVASVWKEQAGTTEVRWLAEGFTIDDTKRLVEAGISPSDAAVMRSAGMTVDESIEWGKAGFHGYGAAAYFKHKATIEQATAWRDAGRTPWDYEDCHDKKTGTLFPEKFDKLVIQEALDSMRTLVDSVEYIDENLETESIEIVEEARNEAKQEWAAAAIKVAEVFARIDERYAERLAKDSEPEVGKL